MSNEFVTPEVFFKEVGEALRRAMKPKITILGLTKPKICWQCVGARPPYRNVCHGFGATPAQAFERWAKDPIPF